MRGSGIAGDTTAQIKVLIGVKGHMALYPRSDAFSTEPAGIIVIIAAIARTIETIVRTIRFVCFSSMMFFYNNTL